MDELAEFIKSNPDHRELKRSLAVQVMMQEYTYYEIRDVLGVSASFISKWRQTYEQQGEQAGPCVTRVPRLFNPRTTASSAEMASTEELLELGQTFSSMWKNSTMWCLNRSRVTTVCLPKLASVGRNLEAQSESRPTSIREKAGNYSVVGSASTLAFYSRVLSRVQVVLSCEMVI